MFGLTLKSRAAEALKRGTRAALTGGFFHHSQAENFGLKDSACAYLYSEALAHQIYSLGLIYGRSLTGKHNWATPEFFFRNVGEALAEEEKNQSLPPGALSRVLLNRFVEFESISPEERRNGAHLQQSAFRVAERDPSADTNSITKALDEAASSFYVEAKRMFGL